MSTPSTLAPMVAQELHSELATLRTDGRTYRKHARIMDRYVTKVTELSPSIVVRATYLSLSRVGSLHIEPLPLAMFEALQRTLGGSLAVNIDNKAVVACIVGNTHKAPSIHGKVTDLTIDELRDLGVVKEGGSHTVTYQDAPSVVCLTH